MKALTLTKSLAVLSAIACMALPSAHATTVTIGLTVDPNLPPGTTPYVLGAANPGAPASDAWDAAYVSGILGLSLGGAGTVGADAIYRSLNTFSGLSSYAAVDTAAGADGSGTQTSITLLSGVSYLVAKYDGQNGGSEVWYVGGLLSLYAGDTVVVDIPANAFGNQNGQYGLSGSAQLLGASTPPPPVPDGGSTLMLLGVAGLGLFAFVRKAQTA